MTEEFKLFLVALGAGIVGLVSATIFANRDQDGDTHSGFNVHGWYAAGILGFLLVCAVASDWGSIKDLATILSFAVGLTSLILALIAIIQGLSSSGSVEATLREVRRAAEDAGRSGSDLSSSAATMREAADDARAAAASALTAVEGFGSVASSIIASNEAGRGAIERLHDDMKSALAVNQQRNQNSVRDIVAPNGLTYGGAAAFYALLLSYREKKWFSLEEIFGELTNSDYERGYINALDDFDILRFERRAERVFVHHISFDLEEALHEMKGIGYKGNLQERHEVRMRQVNDYFEGRRPGSQDDVPPPPNQPSDRDDSQS